MEKYWPDASCVNANGAHLEFRSMLAWALLERFALVAGDTKREDSAGRAVLDLMPAESVVARAFRLADLFVEAAERRGEVRSCTLEDRRESYRIAGELQRVRDDAQYPRGRWEETAEKIRRTAKGEPQP